MTTYTAPAFVSISLPHDAQHCCDTCGYETTNAENDYGEFVCDECEQNAAERAWDRHNESFYGGDGPLPLHEQLIQARRLK